MKDPLVQVSYAALGARTSDALARDESLLHADERERAARFHFDADRRMYVAAHGLVRRALSRRAPVEPSAWRFESTEHGRPEIASPRVVPRLRFSLSHTRTVVACAVGPELDIGLDVEDLVREAPLDVAERFAPSERAALEELPVEQRRGRFFVYWTLKEAYAKARGLGLSIPLDRTAFDVSGDTIRVSFGSSPDDDPGAWRFESWSIDGAYCVALALKTSHDFTMEVSDDPGAAL
jgi:4'-phosphopantetheinyl transferase